jgi:beta-lactam-binding protein with PASTA domain
LPARGLDDLAAGVYPLRAPPPDEKQFAPSESIAPIAVPHLIGLTVPTARRAGHEAGLVVTAADPDGPPLGALTWPGTWLVTAQHPAAGTTLERGDTIAIEFTRQSDDTGTDP